MQPTAPANTHNFISPQAIADPYPLYADLRQNNPVCWDKNLGGWVVTRYADVHALLRDKRMSSSQLDQLMGQLSPEQQTGTQPLRQILTGRLLLTDDPDHRRLRSLMQLAFTPRRVRQMTEFIQQSINEMLDRLQSAGKMDLIADFADPLPSHVITGMLGLPPEDHLQFKGWTDDIYGFLGVSAEPVASRAERANGSARQLHSYLNDLFTKIRLHPRDDLLSGMLEAEEEGQKLSQTELFSNVVGMINAAHETTTNLIGNTVYTLLKTPDLWHRLVDDPELVPSTVEEGLRYESPIQMVGRRAAEDVTINDVTIPAGQRVALILAAANRDPEQFPDADRFDMTRSDNPHVAFGGGPHFCLGAALGRLEGQLALQSLAERLPDLRFLQPDVQWRPYPIFRGLQSLSVTF